MERVVENLLQKFIQDHLSDESGSTEIDDVLLTYLTGILDGIASGEAEDDFDVEEFADMMSAYVPGFDSIDRTLVYEWIFTSSSSLKQPVTFTSENTRVGDDSTSTAAQTSSSRDTNTGSEAVSTCPTTTTDTTTNTTTTSTSTSTTTTTTSGATKRSPRPADQVTVADLRLSGGGGSSGGKQSKKRERRTQTSASRQNCGGDRRPTGGESPAPEPSSGASDESSLMLQDIFPSVGLDAIHGALLRGDGVLELAIGLLLEQQSELAELAARKDPAAAQPGLVSESPPVRGGLAAAAAALDESVRQESARLKEIVLGKYLLVDEADDERSHRPHLQPAAKNKQRTMYRQNHVVSTKGERYTMVAKKEQPDEEAAKKTHINLKPLRKYRFH